MVDKYRRFLYSHLPSDEEATVGLMCVEGDKP